VSADAADTFLDRLGRRMAARLQSESSGYEPYTPSDPETLRRVLQPGDVLLAPWSQDPDADHRAAGRAAREAGEAAGVTVVEYPVWAPYRLTPHQVQETGHLLVPVESTAAAAQAWRRALGQYLTQMEPWYPGWAPLVPADLVQHHLTQLVVEGDSHP